MKSLCTMMLVNEIQYRNGTSGAFCKYFERRTSDQVPCVSNNQWRLHIGFSLPSFLCIKPANKVTHRTPLRTGYKVGGRNMATLSHPHWCEKKRVTSEQKVWHPCFNAVTLTNVCISMHTLSHTCNIASLLHNSQFSTPQVGSVSYQGVIVHVKLEWLATFEIKHPWNISFFMCELLHLPAWTCPTSIVQNYTQD